MSPNVGGIDRTLRIVIGVALIIATVAGLLPVWGWIGGAAGYRADWLVSGVSALRHQDLQAQISAADKIPAALCCFLAAAQTCPNGRSRWHGVA
jgi:hypothetical protein